MQFKLRNTNKRLLTLQNLLILIPSITILLSFKVDSWINFKKQELEIIYLSAQEEEHYRQIQEIDIDCPDKRLDDGHYSTEIIVRLRSISNSYLRLKNSFIDEDIEAIDEEAELFLSNVNSMIESNDQLGLTRYVSLYQSSLKDMIDTDILTNKKYQFAQISETVYCMLKAYPVNYNTAFYLNYCPNADNGLGSYWISEFIEERNPYFGPRKIGCGRNIEKIPFNAE